jgi:hypothetical protein
MTLLWALTLLVGLAVLFFGRHLFWLFVGASGFAAGVYVAAHQLGGAPEWVVLVVGLAAGLLGALMAAFWEVVAIGVGGFLAGSYVIWAVLGFSEVSPGRLSWVVVLVGGVVGAILALLLLNWALIVLSSLIGAALVVSTTPFTPRMAAMAFVALLVLGIVVQAYRVSTGATRPRSR